MKRLLLALILALPLFGAKPTSATCWFADGYLYATGLPINKPLALTTDFYPTGVSWTTPDGNFSLQTTVTEAYFWVRGGSGGGYPKPGAQLNDYKVVAHCVA